jgi:hypothetical protein
VRPPVVRVWHPPGQVEGPTGTAMAVKVDRAS